MVGVGEVVSEAALVVSAVEAEEDSAEAAPPADGKKTAFSRQLSAISIF